MRLTATALACLTCLGLGGCASMPPDGGFGDVDRLTRERIAQTPSLQRTADEAAAARTQATTLLAQTLSADSAVQVALLNHPGLQAAYADLGIAAADLVRAGRPANPSLSFGRLSGHGGVEIDRAVLFDVLGLFTLPLARQVEQGRFDQAKLRAAYQTVGVATEARLAFYEAVAAQQLLGYFGQVHEAAETASELARRMQAAGNFSKLAQMREQSFQADAVAQLARARHQTLAARERLARALGLAAGPADLRLPERLPDLPAAPAGPRDAEQTAIDRRLDVLMARREAEATARALGLTRATRFINVLHAGYQNKSATGEPRSNGYEIELELPLFDLGGSPRLAQAEAAYLQAVNRTTEVAVNARSEVRENYSAYRTAFELARHYRDEVVPLRKRISDENLLRYNGMLASVFDLLADARDQIAGVVGAVQSLRDHWTAETRLQMAMTAGSPGTTSTLAGPAAATSSTPAGH